MDSKTLDLSIFEQRFHSLFYEAPFSAALLSGDQFIVEMANAVSLDLWGKNESILGKPLLEGMPEMKGQEAFLLLTQVYATGTTIEGKEQVAYLHKQGVLTQVYVNFVYTAIKNNEGKITGVFAVGYEVTDQVVARLKLQRSDATMKVAIESTGLGTFELNYQTGLLNTSPRYNEIFEFSESVDHQRYIDCIHPNDLSIQVEAEQQALITGKLRYEVRLTLPGAKLRWVRISGSVIFDRKGAPEMLVGTALDITEQKLSFQNIQESEEKFRTLITETPEVAVGLYLGRELRIQYVNTVMLQFWGKDEKVIGKTWDEALPELQDQPFMKQLDDVFTTGEPFIGREVKALLERNGKLETSYYNYVFKALRNSAGEIYAIHHMAIDVTEQVINKLQLTKSEEDVRNLFEQTPVGIAMFKGESFIVDLVNDTLLSYWGRSRNEVIDKPIFEAIPELTDQGVKRIAENVFRTGISYNSPDTAITLTKNGKEETIIVRFGFRGIKDLQGETVGILAIANDVTDLVLSRRSIEKNEARLKFMADSMPQVVWIAEGDGTVTYYNKRVMQFAGVKQNENGSWEWKGIVHSEDAHGTQRAWTQSVATKSPYEIEHRIMMKDGSYRWHLSRAYAYKTEEGTKWFGTATDVHDQKILEMQLEKLVSERTLELQRSNDDLQQFAHVASHDLKEPVRKIKTFSYKLQDEYRNVLGERGNNFITKIINSTDRMNSMINGVLNYASLPASSYSFVNVSLSKVIENVETDLELLITEKKAKIEHSDLPTINGIEDLIHQLFYNLVNNALKFSKADVPPIITIKYQAKTLNEKPYHEIIVNDNGIGFEAEFAEQIFTSFVRLNAKDLYEGSGLGLALCKKIVERHHGIITASSQKNTGATFTILLPQ